MKEIITSQIREIEANEKVTILLAVESGSRAWGFPSPDSDYDVRFIYVRQLHDYLRLDKQRDVIEWVLDETLDINGWDLDKALRLLYKSNPTLLEWLNSPIIYHKSPLVEELMALANQYFSSKTAIHHYLNMAETNYRGYLKEDLVKVKKYFYALRPILAARWILNRKTPPPIEFATLVEAELVDELKPVVAELLQLKQDLPEKGLAPRISALNTYIEEQLTSLREEASQLSTEKKAWEDLNKFFVSHLLSIDDPKAR